MDESCKIFMLQGGYALYHIDQSVHSGGSTAASAVIDSLSWTKSWILQYIISSCRSSNEMTSARRIKHWYTEYYTLDPSYGLGCP